MEKYLHILLRLAAEPWAIEPNKLAEMVAFVLFKAEGGMLAPAEVEARVLSSKREREVAAAPGNVAVLPVHGLIMPRVANLRLSEAGTGLDALARGFREMLANDNVKAIIADIDSPGGQTGGLDEFAQEVFEARGTKPLIAQVNSLAASAAYYLASQFDEVVITPSGRAGSIGVYTIHDDISKALEMKGISRTIIRSGPNKAAGDPFGPLSDEAREKMLRMVNFANDQFVKAVARGRGVSQKFVDENMGAGDMFDPPELIKRKMADRVDSMRHTLARFGVEVSPVKRSQATSARAALALGRVPATSDLEALLREAGASKSLASALATGGTRRAEPGEPVPDDPNRGEPGGQDARTAALLNELVQVARETAASAAKP